MNNIKYLFQFVIVIFLFLIFKLLGLKFSSYISGKLFQIVGPFFRSKKVIDLNLKNVYPELDLRNKKKIINGMWNNYGRVFAEYIFIKDFRKNKYENIIIEGKEVLDQIKKDKKQVIFISGHFGNFELMAMEIEKSGINLAAIYRPLNNIFLNKVMEKIRKDYICENQIKKGVGGLKNLMKLIKKNFSIALMLDQRVSEGIKVNFFKKGAYTTTIPAQLVKKFDIPIVPVSIKRYENVKFKMTIHQPINFKETETIEIITEKLNKILEKMVIENPQEWIWTHNRWK
tara:strand:- start:4046 stop:4903 length:858 start_codon:yes stop_codon:yes gene_type:complete